MFISKAWTTAMAGSLEPRLLIDLVLDGDPKGLDARVPTHRKRLVRAWSVFCGAVLFGCPVSGNGQPLPPCCLTGRGAGDRPSGCEVSGYPAIGICV